MTIRLITTAAVLAAFTSAVFAESPPPAGERALLPSAISMTCKVGRGAGEFDVLYDNEEKTLSFVPGEKLQSVEYKIAHGLLIILGRQGDVEYSARIAERPFVTIRDDKRLDIFPCFEVKTSADPAPVLEVNSGWRG